MATTATLLAGEELPQNLLHQPVDRQIDTNPSFLSVVAHTQYSILGSGNSLRLFHRLAGKQTRKWVLMVVLHGWGGLGWCWCAIHSFSSPVIYPILLNPVILISILKGHFSSSLTYYYQLIKGRSEVGVENSSYCTASAYSRAGIASVGFIYQNELFASKMINFHPQHAFHRSLNMFAYRRYALIDNVIIIFFNEIS